LTKKKSHLTKRVQSDLEFIKVCTQSSDDPRINECQTLKYMM